jgi:hypothetical protein
MRLDNFPEQHTALLMPITAIKIDVEDHENTVLQGTTCPLRNNAHASSSSNT